MSAHVTRDEALALITGLTPQENNVWGVRLRELLATGLPLDETIRQSLTEIYAARGHSE